MRIHPSRTPASEAAAILAARHGAGAAAEIRWRIKHSGSARAREYYGRVLMALLGEELAGQAERAEPAAAPTEPDPTAGPAPLAPPAIEGTLIDATNYTALRPQPGDIAIGWRGQRVASVIRIRSNGALLLASDHGLEYEAKQGQHWESWLEAGGRLIRPSDEEASR